MKKYHNIKKRLTPIIAFIIVAGIFPSTTAKSVEYNNTTELIDLREENIKHFDMGNGTYQAIVYSHPVHQKDANGEWKDIDFGMTLVRSRGVNMYKSNSGGTAFAARYSENQPLMTLSDKNSFLSMSLVLPKLSSKSTTTPSISAAKLSEATYGFNTFEEAQNSKFSNNILYENILPGVSIEYLVDPFVVKENIIVKEQSKKYEYTFLLDMDGLYPILYDDSYILLYDTKTNEQKFYFPIPYMYDALGNMSHAVFYSLVPFEDKYYLTITADAKWINEEGRNFPITIDPTVVRETAVTQDTYINSATPNSVLGGKDDLWVRNNRISYIKTALPDVPSNMYLHRATLTMFYCYYNYVDSGWVEVTAHQVKEDWSEGTLTWNSASTSDNYKLYAEELCEINAYGTGTATENTPAQIDFDITEAVLAWNHGAPNYGIGLRYGSDSVNLSVYFKSKDCMSDYKPRISYQYGTRFQATMELQYDEAYDDRYSSSTQTAEQRIQEEAAALKSFYSTEFEIDVGYSTPKDFVSYADHCREEYNDRCNCGTCQNTNMDGIADIDDVVFKSYHHKNIFNIIARLQPPVASLNATMAYIGHKTCIKTSSGECIDNETIKGQSFPDFRIATIYNFDGKSSETVTLIHEFGHMLGIRDHYDENTFSPENQLQESTRAEYCLYGTGHTLMQSVTNINICTTCREKLRVFVNRYKC